MFSAMRARTPRVRRGVNGGDASATRVTKRFPRNARVARRAKSASRDFVRGARVARAHRKTISNRRGAHLGMFECQVLNGIVVGGADDPGAGVRKGFEKAAGDGTSRHRLRAAGNLIHQHNMVGVLGSFQGALERT